MPQSASLCSNSHKVKVVPCQHFRGLVKDDRSVCRPVVEKFCRDFSLNNLSKVLRTLDSSTSIGKAFG